MVPLYKLPVYATALNSLPQELEIDVLVCTGFICSHRAINLFLQSYRGMWLKDDIKHHAILMDHLTVSMCN